MGLPITVNTMRENLIIYEKLCEKMKEGNVSQNRFQKEGISNSTLTRLKKE